MNKKKLYLVIGKYMSASYTDFIIESLPSYSVIIVKFEDLLNGATFVERDVKTIVLYSGGADVNPDLYSEQLGKHTHIDKVRDKYEQNMFSTLKYYDVLNVGICRGAQFLTVMSGGSLIQHVEGHTKSHEIVIPTIGKSVIATSTHHQMMYPYELPSEKFTLLAWSKFFQSDTYLNGRNEEISIDAEFLEPEIVFYSNTKSLAIQGHPEMGGAEPEFKKACAALIGMHLTREKN